MRRTSSTCECLILAGAVAAGLGLLGCASDRVPELDAGSGSGGSTTGSPVEGSSSTGTAAASTSTGSTIDESADDTLGVTGTVDPTDAVFLPGPDVGLYGECDLVVQDCPPGYKCMPWGDGVDYVNSVRCSPVVAEPVGLGEPCHVERSPVSGLDDCDYGAICWDVDPATGEGECMPFCMGTQANLLCEDPDRICEWMGHVPLCTPFCDPLLQDCPAGEGCYPIEPWTCAPDDSGDLGAYGDPCDFINRCDPGLVCLNGGAVPPGLPCEGTSGCCTELCDVEDEAGDLQCTGVAEGQTCQAWYGERYAPPGFERVGACALPL